MVSLEGTQDVVNNIINKCYDQVDKNDEMNYQLQVYLLNKAGFLSSYALILKYNPFFDQKPSFLAVLCPIVTQKEFGSILFNQNGHILSVNEQASIKFGITTDFVYKPTRSDLVIYDLFKGLSECIKVIEVDKAEETFYYIELDNEVIDNFVKYRQIRKHVSGQLSDNNVDDFENNKETKINRKKRIDVMVRILPADPLYKDIYILNFNFSDTQSIYYQEKTLTNSDVDITENISFKSHFRSTNALTALEELEILPENIDIDNREDDNETKNLLAITNKNNNLDLLKNIIAEKKTSKTFRMYYIGIAILFLVGFMTFLIGVLYQNYYLNKSLKLQEYEVTFKNLHLAVWHIMYYCRKLDGAMKKGSPSLEYIKFNKDMLNENMIIAKNKLSSLLEAHQLYIIEKNPSLNNISMTLLIEATEYQINKPIGDIYLHFIESVNSLIKNNKIDFSATNLYPDFYFIIINGMHTLTVS